ncbi:hypothetical protein JB92DRAFT_2981997 [Gautieria morchelliformis]|nr:hypothetical protein JB92DRAFT_2981997 [Gautieria morchelliformis]
MHVAAMNVRPPPLSHSVPRPALSYTLPPYIQYGPSPLMYTFCPAGAPAPNPGAFNT